MGATSQAWQLALALALLLPLSVAAGAVRPMAMRKMQVCGRPAEPSASQSAARLVACLTFFPSEEGVPDRVEVRENRGSAGPRYSLYFIVGWPDWPKTAAKYPGYSPVPPDIFFSGANLIAEWVAGDRPVIQVFHIVKGGAKLVFERGARAGFEYWGDTILQNDAAIGADGNYHATTTKLWRWDGERYKLLATVPYGRRLFELGVLEQQRKIR
jgi:hypothetical protein